MQTKRYAKRRIIIEDENGRRRAAEVREEEDESPPVKQWVTGVVASVGDMAKGLATDYMRRRAELAEIRAVEKYVSVVEGVRKGVATIIGAVALTLLIFTGFLLLHAALFLWLPWTMESRILAMLILGLVYAVPGLLLLKKLTGSNLWMRITGADRMIDDVTSDYE
jgi:hypothetical protein